MGKYRDFDALAYENKVQGDDDHIALNHVSKRLKKDRGSEVVFDPAHHKLSSMNKQLFIIHLVTYSLVPSRMRPCE